MTIEPTGVFVDGREMEAVTIRGGGLAARAVTFGASLASLTVPTPAGPREVLLGFDRDEDLVAQRAYINCIAGRCANRIRDGRFSLDGVAYRLATNDGPHPPPWRHGRLRPPLWTVEAVDEGSVTLAIVSPDGEEGYPGRVEARCRYGLSDDRRLTITLTATTDAPTLVNLAAHGYFALDDEPTVLGHRLQIAADRTRPPGPTWSRPARSRLSPARSTISARSGSSATRRSEGHRPYDTISSSPTRRRPKPRFAARVSSPASGVALEVWTTEPGCRSTTAGSSPFRSRCAAAVRRPRFGGLCLEPQRWPDAINHPDFAGAVLRPGETYRQVTEYRFRLTAGRRPKRRRML